ncbi:MAG TPA: hypothetical protein PKJ85_01870 [Nitrosomonas nitrosa]|nr:hypothetical protein [Nitrosomonas nitrosa]
MVERVLCVYQSQKEGIKRVSEKPVNIGIDNKPKSEQDKIDLNHEMSGMPTGRRQRFLTQNDYGVHGEESEKKKAERRYSNLLEYMLAEDARYAKLYYEVQDTLNQARRAAEHALSDINKQLEVAERTLQMMRDNAARLDDGTLVFRSTADGHVYTEDGRKLSDDEASGIAFSENAPSREAYNQAKSSVETARTKKTEVEAYQRDIDHAQERLRDVENPLTLEELETIKRDIPSHRLYSYGVTAQAQTHEEKRSPAAQDGKENFNMPPMSRQFDFARLGQSDNNPLPQFTNIHTIAPAL